MHKALWQEFLPSSFVCDTSFWQTGLCHSHICCSCMQAFPTDELRQLNYEKMRHQGGAFEKAGLSSINFSFAKKEYSDRPSNSAPHQSSMSSSSSGAHGAAQSSVVPLAAWQWPPWLQHWPSDAKKQAMQVDAAAPTTSAVHCPHCDRCAHCATLCACTIFHKHVASQRWCCCCAAASRNAL